MSPAPRRSSRALRVASIGALLGLWAACSSGETSKKKPEPPLTVEDLDVVAIRTDEPSIGEFLAKIDLAMRAWTKLAQTAVTEEERRQARELERFLRHQTTQRRAELVAQLETGPLYNRMRAAPALGFTDASALSPLLAALSDPEPDVVHNALLGLALLSDPTTPLEPICRWMQEGAEPHLRANAAYAVRCVVESGGSSTCVVPAARAGMLDAEALVRVQSALILGLVADGESLGALNDQLYDPTPLVSRSAVEALSLVAARDRSQRGPVARALVKAVEQAPPTTRSHAKAALIELAGTDQGSREDWLRWAQGLP